MAAPKYTIPGMSLAEGETTVKILQERLRALIDLQLTLKHVHWNVVGPTFIGVHEMIDPQVDAVRLMSDAVAERIAALGSAPNGLAGALVAERDWDDYSLGRAGVIEHLGALDMVYRGVVEGHRNAIEATEEPDPVTQDLLIDQSHELEQFHWFVRAHIETTGGALYTQDASSEREAADMAASAVDGGTR